MAYYDLRCTKCKEEFNVKATLEEREKKLIKCPSCCSNELERIYSTMNIMQSSGNSKKDVPSCSTGGCSTGSCPFSNMN
jgi:putative FmdB family regulatory protein